jgi:ADP-heptose:LPS heptosyltransferase
MSSGIFSSQWRKRFRNRLLLGAKPGGAGELNSAHSITLVKRDNIGDFILATTFLNRAYENWNDKDVTFVCSPQIREIAAMFYPKWIIQSPVETKYDFRFGYLRKGNLKAQVRKWPAGDFMLSLRAMRRPSEVIFESWVPAKYKVALCNQYEKFEPELLRLLPDEHTVYNEIIDCKRAASGADVCQDIKNYRVFLDYCFPSDKEINRHAFPEIPESFIHSVNVPRLPVGKYLAVFPSPSRRIRQYPLPLLARAVTEMANRHGLDVVVLGGSDDADEARRLLLSLQIQGGKISLAGKLGIGESIACIARAVGMLGVESFGAHAAVAAGVPAVVITGGGHYGQFAPWGPEARVRWISYKMPCFGCSWNCSQPHPYCIEKITQDTIVEAFDDVMKCKPR